MIETKFKNSEVGLIPEDWKAVPLSAIGEVKMCKRILKEQTDITGDVPFYKIGTFGKEADAYIPRELYEQFKGMYPYPKKGSILISAAGTIGRTVVFDGEDAYFQDSNIVWIDHKEKDVVNPYLEHYFKIISWKSENGGTISRLYNDNLKSTFLCYPEDKIEQSRIATALSDIDDLIATTKKLIEKKRNIKEGAMQELLSGKRRLPGFTEEWEEGIVSENVVFCKGTGLSKSKLVPNGKYPCILYGEIFTTYNYEVIQCVSHTNSNEGTPSVKGDVLMPASTTTKGIDLAKAVCLYEDDVLLGGDIIIMRNDFGKFYPLFFSYYITEIMPKQVEEVAQGTTIIHLQPSKLGKLSIRIPTDLKEQKAIADVLSDMDSEIQSLESRLTKYQSLKQGMMQQLLTGKIRLI